MPRQSGKDFTHMEEAVAIAQCNAKTDVLVTAPGERQALETLDKAKDWAECYKLPIANITDERPMPQALIKAKTIHFPNRSRIIAVPGLPHLARGYCAHLFATECDHFEDFKKFWQAVLPSISNKSKGLKCARIYSTPITKEGLLYKIVDSHILNPQPGFKKTWSVHHMNIFDCIKEGLDVDPEELRRALDDDEAWAQEFLCEFRDYSNVLLPYDLIKLAESDEASSTIGHDFFTLRQQYQSYCGIDFGRVHDPTVCVTLQRVSKTLVTKEVLVLRNMPMPNQWEILLPRVKAAAKTCLDYTGLGTYIGDDAVRLFGEHNPDGHKFGKVERCTFTSSLKRVIFPRLRRAFEAPTILRIPEDIELREDLHAMEQIVTNAQYDYRAPHTKDGHSDRCTALALAVRAAENGAGGNQSFVAIDRQARVGQILAGRRDRSMAG